MKFNHLKFHKTNCLKSQIVYYLIYTNNIFNHNMKNNLSMNSHLIGIDSNAKKTRISVNQESEVSGVQVVDDRSLGKVSHVSHILQEF